MIPIEQQVTSLETSLRLKELGVPQGESYFVWCTGTDGSIRTKKGEILTNEKNSEVVGGILSRRDWRMGNNYFANLTLIICDAFTLIELYKLDDISDGITELDYEDILKFTSNRIAHRIEIGTINPRDLKL